MTSAFVFPRTRVLAVAVAAALLAIVAAQLVAARPGGNAGAATAGIVHISMTVKGHKQGFFKGDNPNSKAGANLINVVAYQYSFTSPRDPASGLPTGRRQHMPVVITHEIGPSSPQFFLAGVTNEVLTEVVITFSKTQVDGKEVNFYRVTLMDAQISEFRQHSSGDAVLEDISFAFRKILQEDLIAHTSAEDDWESAV